jgi:hypothetical protein
MQNNKIDFTYLLLGVAVVAGWYWYNKNNYIQKK